MTGLSPVGLQSYRLLPPAKLQIPRRKFAVSTVTTDACEPLSGGIERHCGGYVGWMQTSDYLRRSFLDTNNFNRRISLRYSDLLARTKGQTYFVAPFVRGRCGVKHFCQQIGVVSSSFCNGPAFTS